MPDLFLLLASAGIVAGIAYTLWVFWNKRHVDKQGLEKGTAKHPEQVKADNPPDR